MNNLSNTSARGEAIKRSMRQEKRIERLKANSKHCIYEGYEGVVLTTYTHNNKRCATIELLDSNEIIDIYYEQLIFEH